MFLRAEPVATEAEIYSGLREIFADVFLRDDLVLRPDLTAKQVQGWDSFKQIEIIMASEERWSIKFSARELDSLRSVGDLAGLVEAKTGRRCAS
jgi:acyl carrier protein